MKIDAAKVMELVRTVKPLFLDHEQAARIEVKGLADFVTQVVACNGLVGEELPAILGNEFSNTPQAYFQGMSF